ncbi:MAG: hypothetical protein EOP09_11580, partial [Proteobacteria bacterium]
MMELHEIKTSIKDQQDAGKSDDEILAYLAPKLAALYSEREIIQMLYQQPADELKRRYKNLNTVLCFCLWYFVAAVAVNGAASVLVSYNQQSSLWILGA